MNVLIADLIRHGLLDFLEAFLACEEADVEQLEAKFLKLLGRCHIFVVGDMVAILLLGFLLVLVLALGKVSGSLLDLFVLFESAHEGLQEGQ